ncbi:MAG: DUF1850 domain-containing protein [Deinococcales bacterium]
MGWLPSQAQNTLAHLQVWQENSLILDIPLENPYWIVRWHHSVTGIEVSDYYRLDNGCMLLSATHTPAFDAGLGHIPGRGRLLSDEQHGYWIVDIDEVVKNNRYYLRVGSLKVNHRIIYEGQSYSLSELAEHERVEIRVSEAVCALP